MSDKKITKQFDELNNPQIGKSFSLNDDDEQFISNYTDAYDKLTNEEKLFVFRNVLRSSSERCGFASSGANQYLINTDTGNRYRVTVRTYWRKGMESHQTDNIYIMEAGGRKYMGCAMSGYETITYEIVGEVQI